MRRTRAGKHFSIGIYDWKAASSKFRNACNNRNLKGEGIGKSETSEMRITKRNKLLKNKIGNAHSKNQIRAKKEKKNQLRSYKKH
jgi:hypothetical protein